MEQEMKYSIPNKETADAIWEDAQHSECTDLNTAEPVVMKAVYFDTPDHALTNSNLTLRIRAEGERCIATVKWGGCVSNGFHQKEEINVPVESDISFINPSVDIFKGCEVGDKLLELTEGKQLINLLETRFLRRRLRLNYQGNLIELSVDTGNVVTDNGEVPIQELELELYVGQAESVVELGQKMAEQYGLSPKDSSKFADGIALLNK